MKILDAGSGSQDDDYFHIYLDRPNVIHIDIVKTGFHIEAQCDIHNLPFLNNAFEIVHASHILEHICNPYLALAELKRVSKKYVIIKVPNAAHYRGFFENPDHIYSWTPETLEHLLSRFFEKVKIIQGYRFVRSPNQNRLKWRLSIFKTYLVALFFGKNEIIAICQKEE